MRRICTDRMQALRARPTAAAPFALLVAGLIVTAPVVPAAAQTANVQGLVNRIDRMQEELNTLQQYVYRGDGQGAATGTTGSAPPIAGDATGPAVVARLSVRITQLEGEIQRLTGQNEEFGHSIQQMKARLDKLVSDVDSRLTALERRAGTTADTTVAADNAAAPVGNGAAPAQQTGQQPASGLGRGPQVLGHLRIDQASGAPVPVGAAAPPQQQAALPKETPRQLYARAQSLLLKEQDVAGAERLLREFIDKYPNNPLAANAHYWLGRTYFVRKDYKQAAFTFADAFQKYPKSDKAAANLLNLGMSLQQLGKISEACTAYSRLLQNFPNAQDSIRRRAVSERRRAKCS